MTSSWAAVLLWLAVDTPLTDAIALWSTVNWDEGVGPVGEYQRDQHLDAAQSQSLSSLTRVRGHAPPAEEFPEAAKSLESKTLALALEYASAKDVNEGAASATVTPGLTAVIQPFAPTACTVTSTVP